MPDDASTRLVRKLRQQAAAHIKAGRILRDMASRIEKQRRAGDQLAHLVQDIDTDVLITQATHHLRSISNRAVATQTPATSSKDASHPAAPVQPKTKIVPRPTIALLRVLFTDIPPKKNLDTVLNERGNKTPRGMLLGNIRHAHEQLELYKDGKLPQAQPELVQLFQDLLLGHPTNWELFTSSLRQWNVLKNSDAA